MSGLNIQNNSWNGWTSSSIGTLFSGFTPSGVNSLSSIVSDYSQIKNGSYGKLVKAYYDKIMVEKDERLKLKEQLKDARLELSKAEEVYHQAYQKVFDIYNQLADLSRAYYVDGKKVSRKEYLKAIEEINKL